MHLKKTNNLDLLINKLSRLASEFQDLAAHSMSVNTLTLGYTVQLIWGHVHWQHTSRSMSF